MVHQTTSVLVIYISSSIELDRTVVSVTGRLISSSLGRHTKAGLDEWTPVMSVCDHKYRFRKKKKKFHDEKLSFVL